MTKILLSSVVAIALLTGCGEEKKAVETKPAVEVKVEEVKKVEVVKSAETKLVEQVKDSTAKVAQSVKKAGTEVANKIVEESKEIAAIGSEAVKSVSDKVLTKTEEVTKEVVEKANATKEKIEQSINTMVATKTQTQEATTTSSVNAKTLYVKCAGCHGQTGQKAALGKSAIIKGWDKAKTITALNGYKAGTYGGVMKGVMKSQVSNLSNEEVDALGAYISSF